MAFAGNNDRQLNFIDLFAGAGGLSEGFVSCGFKPLAHVEMNRHACDTLQTRASYHWLRSKGGLELYRDYLEQKITRQRLFEDTPRELLDAVICEEMGPTTMAGIFQRIDASIEKAGADHVDLIIGGPPCQAYSIVGRGRKDMRQDPRNLLYQQYILVLRRYKPIMFVFENVPGLLSAGNGEHLRHIRASFEEEGYKLEFHLQDASDYGVLQHRKRLILVGWKEDSDLCYPTLAPVSINATVNDLLIDLPALQPGETSRKYRRGRFSNYLREEKLRESGDVLTWHTARPQTERDREIYRIAIRMWTENKNRLRYTELPQELQTHNNKISFLDRFKVVERDDPACHTMVAHISKDGHYYIHPDIDQARSLSVREAARIQSFPDNYYFEGPRTAAFMQIGNAVPPLLAKAIAKAVRKELTEENDDGKDTRAVLSDHT